MEDISVTECRKKKDGAMSSVAATVKQLIGHEKASLGVKTDEARKIIARKVGVPPGSIERLLAGRLVHIERITDRINAYVAKRLTNQIAVLEHEIEMAKRMPVGVERGDIECAEIAVQEAKRALKK
jgi:hypothetical protein